MRLRACSLPSSAFLTFKAAPYVDQVSEDHCWVSLDGSGQREASAELTTTNAAKRGAAVDEAVCGRWQFCDCIVWSTLGRNRHRLVHLQLMALTVLAVCFYMFTSLAGIRTTRRLDEATVPSRHG